jgi:hypothetical protein
VKTRTSSTLPMRELPLIARPMRNSPSPCQDVGYDVYVDNDPLVLAPSRSLRIRRIRRG